MLKAAGLELTSEKDAGETEARKTWQEILGQWLSMLARSLCSLVGSEVTCANAAEQAPPPDQQEWAGVVFVFDDGAKSSLALAFSPALLDVVTAPPAPSEEADSHAETPPEAFPHGETQPTMELLLDVELPVSISFGKTELPLKDVLKLTTGSIVELNRAVNEPVEILVNRCLVARGEVVVVDGNYGVRVLRIVSRQERLRSVR
jgi:flagellar motor switch protein FliN/FliY